MVFLILFFYTFFAHLFFLSVLLICLFIPSSVNLKAFLSSFLIFNISYYFYFLCFSSFLLFLQMIWIHNFLIFPLLFFLVHRCSVFIELLLHSEYFYFAYFYLIQWILVGFSWSETVRTQDFNLSIFPLIFLPPSLLSQLTDVSPAEALQWFFKRWTVSALYTEAAVYCVNL